MTRPTSATRSRRAASGGSRRSIPSYRSAFADLFGLRLIATGMPVEQIRQGAQAGRPEFHRAHQGRLCLRKSARAAARDDGRRLEGRRLRRADRERLAAGCRSGQNRVAGKGARAAANVQVRSAGTARLVRYANTEIVVEVDSPSGGILVLNDVWHPWWRATVDGVETEILRANVIFRAVAVPPGKHTVRFTFEPLRGAWRELRRSEGSKSSLRERGDEASSYQRLDVRFAAANDGYFRNPGTPCRARWCCGATARAVRPRPPPRSRA